MGLAFGLGVHTGVLPCMSHSREKAGMHADRMASISNPVRTEGVQSSGPPPWGNSPPRPLWLASEQRAVEDGKMPDL
jgi:hypothetical protein